MPTTGSSGLPSGFPKQLAGLALWSKNVEEQDYVYHLTENDIVSIESALKHFQGVSSTIPYRTYFPSVLSAESLQKLLGLGISHHELNKEHFPLSPLLCQKLRYISQNVHNGRLFAVLRGLDPQKYSEPESVIIYGGVASHVGKDRADMSKLHVRCADQTIPG